MQLVNIIYKHLFLLNHNIILKINKARNHAINNDYYNEWIFYDGEKISNNYEKIILSNPIKFIKSKYEETLYSPPSVRDNFQISVYDDNTSDTRILLFHPSNMDNIIRINNNNIDLISYI